jgi:hypothetical protein
MIKLLKKYMDIASWLENVVSNKQPEAKSAVQGEGGEELGRMSMAGSGIMKKFYSAQGWDELLTGVVVYGSIPVDDLTSLSKVWI